MNLEILKLNLNYSRQKLIHKDEQRRSPSPSVSDNEDIGSDGEGGYASSCEDSEAEMALEPLIEDLNEFF